MGAYADQPAVRNNATVTHTLTRHRDILQGTFFLVIILFPGPRLTAVSRLQKRIQQDKE